VDVQRCGQGDGNERPEVFLVVLFSLIACTVHLFQAGFSKDLHHLNEGFCLHSLVRHDHSQEELGWDAESKDSVNVGTDDLEVHEGHKELLMGTVGSLA